MVELLNDKVSVPNVETTYWCRTHRLPEELEDKHHVIQYEAVIQEGSEPLVSYKRFMQNVSQMMLRSITWNYSTAKCHQTSLSPIGTALVLHQKSQKL